jgi:hypothetical protein
MFHDESAEAVWRWACNHVGTYFSKNAEKQVKDFRANSKKYGAAIKAFAKCNELLIKLPIDEGKLVKAEEDATLKFNALEKAKAARVEAEAKRQAKLANKKEKEGEKRAKKESTGEKEKPVKEKKEPTEAELRKKAEAEQTRWQARKAELQAWLDGARSWQSFVDFWAIDWDHGDLAGPDGRQVFDTDWQSYRTARGKKGGSELILSASHRYPGPGRYTVAARVTDVFGNDGIQRVTVEVV